MRDGTGRGDQREGQREVVHPPVCQIVFRSTLFFHHTQAALCALAVAPASWLGQRLAVEVCDREAPVIHQQTTL